MTIPSRADLIDITDRLDRADENIKAVKGLVVAYYTSEADRLTARLDPAQGTLAARTDARRPPERFFTIVGDILHELRSALDHMAWRLVELEGNIPNEHTKWPILTTPPTPYQQGPNKGASPPPNIVPGVSPMAREIAKRHQPYQLGQYAQMHDLYWLHELNIIDKHRHVAVDTSGWYRNIAYTGHPGRSPVDLVASIQSVSEYGAEILLTGHPEVDVDLGATFQILVHEAAIGVKREVIGTLDEMRDVVGTVITECTETCFPAPV